MEEIHLTAKAWKILKCKTENIYTINKNHSYCINYSKQVIQKIELRSPKFEWQLILLNERGKILKLNGCVCSAFKSCYFRLIYSLTAVPITKKMHFYYLIILYTICWCIVKIALYSCCPWWKKSSVQSMWWYSV